MKKAKEEVITEYFSNLDILVDSDVLFATQNKQESYILNKIYKMAEQSSSITIEDMGNWDTGLGLTITEEETIVARRRKNLMGTVLNTCIVITNNDSMRHLTDKR